MINSRFWRDDRENEKEGEMGRKGHAPKTICGNCIFQLTRATVGLYDGSRLENFSSQLRCGDQLSTKVPNLITRVDRNLF